MTPEEFRAHSDKYTWDTCILAHIKTNHPDFQALLAAGKKVVPYLFDDLNRENGSPWSWFLLLREILHDGPTIPDTAAGRYSSVRMRWLRWAVNHGYITEILPTREEKKAQEEYEARVPFEYRAAHRLCGGHRERVLASEKIGCFHCGAIFTPAEIEEWIDSDQTALCPHCGIDSILPGEALITPEFLAEMRHWFFDYDMEKV